MTLLSALRFLAVTPVLVCLACSTGGDDDAASSGGAAAGRAGAAQTSGGAPNAGGLGGSGATAGGTSGTSAGDAGKNAGGAATNVAGMAGTSGTAAGSDSALIVPANLQVTALEGGTGSLVLVALTVRKGPTNTELYAALKNDGDMPACDAGLSVELYGKDQQSIAAGIGALLTEHVYQRTDGSGTPAACVAPGETTMAAITDLPPDIVISDLGYAVYHCTYFVLDLVPLGTFSVNDVKSVEVLAGTTYTGTFVNGLDVPVSSPSVTIFPLNSVGRPLGAAIATGMDEIAAGGTWAFQTGIVTTPGVGYAAYPSAAPSSQ